MPEKKEQFQLLCCQDRRKQLNSLFLGVDGSSEEQVVEVRNNLNLAYDRFVARSSQ